MTTATITAPGARRMTPTSTGTLPRRAASSAPRRSSTPSPSGARQRRACGKTSSMLMITPRHSEWRSACEFPLHSSEFSLSLFFFQAAWRGLQLCESPLQVPVLPGVQLPPPAVLGQGARPSHGHLQGADLLLLPHHGLQLRLPPSQEAGPEPRPPSPSNPLPAPAPHQPPLIGQAGELC